MLQNFTSVFLILLVTCGQMGLFIAVAVVLSAALRGTPLWGMMTKSAQSQCLIQFTFSSGLVQPAVAIGAGVGGLVLGSLIGVAIAFFFIRRYYEKKMQADVASLHGSSGVTTYSSLPRDFQYRSIPTSGTGHPTHASGSSGGLNQLRPGSMQYHIEPFVMPDENGRLANEARSTGHTATTPEPVSSPSAAAPQQSHVYVLHHDSNVPPVTIYHESGTEIVELPPRYPRNTSQSDMLSDGQTRTDLSSRSDGSRTGSSQPLAIHEPRQLAQLGKSARLPWFLYFTILRLIYIFSLV